MRTLPSLSIRAHAAVLRTGARRPRNPIKVRRPAVIVASSSSVRRLVDHGSATAGTVLDERHRTALGSITLALTYAATADNTVLQATMAEQKLAAMSSGSLRRPGAVPRWRSR